jgi:D-3-phosphoglycerate dehydrogenase
VRALGYEVEIELASLMLFVVNEDRPGVIGRLGTILGEERINIANMAVSRNRRSAKALMVLTLDSPISPEVLERLRNEPGFVEARSIVLERA